MKWIHGLFIHTTTLIDSYRAVSCIYLLYSFPQSRAILHSHLKPCSIKPTNSSISLPHKNPSGSKGIHCTALACSLFHQNHLARTRDRALRTARERLSQVTSRLQLGHPYGSRKRQEEKKRRIKHRPMQREKRTRYSRHTTPENRNPSQMGGDLYKGIWYPETGD